MFVLSNFQNVLLIAITESIKFDDRALKLGSGTLPIPSPINCCSHDADDKSQQTEQTTCEPSPLSMPPPQDSPQTELAPRKRRRKRDDPQSCVTNAEVSIWTIRHHSHSIFSHPVKFTHSPDIWTRNKIGVLRKQVKMCCRQLIMRRLLTMRTTAPIYLISLTHDLQSAYPKQLIDMVNERRPEFTYISYAPSPSSEYAW